ncbi:MAG: DUF1622 domain-containing protein [Streptococcaceae bacterium]|jgi:uncharacterized membrane protein|nr:DUF1622 domain-containing protein [Streptococcaceae bacterium]
MPKIIVEIFEYIVVGISIASILILLRGLLVAGIEYFKAEIKSKQTKLQRVSHVRSTLGIYVLLSLEVVIAADIIESIIHPTLNDIFKLGLLVIIRTVISVFLKKEISE